MRRLVMFVAAMGFGTVSWGQGGERADGAPRKVVVGTVIYGPYDHYEGLEERLERLGGFVGVMAEQAKERWPGRGLDLAILPETTVTAVSGTPAERAVVLSGQVEEAFGDMARKHRAYVLACMDLKEGTEEAPFYSNAAVLFDRNGKVAGIYRKRNPVAVAGSSAMEGGIRPGEESPVFDCDFGKLGVQICWDIQFADGWAALAELGAEIVAWPTQSPATVLPSVRAATNRYYVVSSTWRNNATVYEPTGMVAARTEQPGGVLVHEVDLSWAIVGWNPTLHEGEALKERYGERVGFHYDRQEDMGLFWSNDPAMPIGEMVKSIGAEELDSQVERNRSLRRDVIAAEGR